jgi:hypothetical protein
VLLHSKRIDGVSKHVQVARLTSIRECCIDDPRARAAWWEAILHDLADLEKRGVLGFPEADPRFQKITSALRQKVPYAQPSTGGRTRASWAKKPKLPAEAQPTKLDCFAILGLSKDCSQEELKKAWRKAAADHHPDRGGDPSAFRRIKEAYELCRSVRESL